MLPPPVYPITDPLPAGASGLAELLAKLMRGGATWIQVREKKLSDDELLAQLEPIRKTRESGFSLIINDRVALVGRAGIAGVHLGQEDAPVAQTRRDLPGAIIGISTHSLDQAVAAASLPVDYISIGPVFPTATKAGHAAVGLDVVRHVRAAVDKPMVAIGGISLSNAAQLWELGVESVAVISDIMGSGDIERRVSQYLELWRSIHD